MILDGKPLTKRQSSELAAFLARHDLPLLQNVPFVQRMLFDDMQRSKAGQRARYIIQDESPRSDRTLQRSDRTASMKTMRAAGSTLQQIGETFGITAERVRQLLHGMPRPKPRPNTWPRSQLAKAMTCWLRDAGYRKCSDCGLWKPDISWKRCKDCNRRRSHEYYATHRSQGLAAAKRLRDKIYRSPSGGTNAE
jgi:hypothetical protein